MFKNAKVVLLPTNQKEKIKIAKFGNRLAEVYVDKIKNKDILGQHIYIISDDKIEEGDYLLSDERERKTDNNGIPKWKLEKCIKIENGWIFVENRPDEGLNFDWSKKIISTTDKSLIIGIISQMVKERYRMNTNVLLPQPSDSFIKKYIEEYNKDNIITDILVEYEELFGFNINDKLKFKKSEEFITVKSFNYKNDPNLISIEEQDENQMGIHLGHLECPSNILKLKVNSKDNTITIKRVKDSYTKEEVEILLYKAINKAVDWHGKGDNNYLQLTETWIKQNL